MDNPDYYKRLIERYREGKATPDEIKVFFHFLNEGKLDDYLTEDMEESLSEEMASQKFTRRILGRKWLAYAAMIAMVCSLTYIFFLPKQPAPQIANSIEKPVNDVLAATDQAVLTLADGREIALDDSFSGEIAEQSGLAIRKDENGLVQYVQIDKAVGDKLTFNEIRTPKGGKYRLLLADGTSVWLNSASQIKFPVNFSSTQREVFLMGEAYFEVAPDKKRPFVVQTEQQQIQVLGTHFNVKAYGEDAISETTLLEGRVSVSKKRRGDGKTFSNAVTLQPGQQALLNSTSTSETITILEVNTEEAMAWKNGVFLFKETPVHEIMKQLSRWYNVDIETAYMPDYSFNGYIPRSEPLSKVLEMLELTGDFKFKIHNNQISIIK